MKRQLCKEFYSNNNKILQQVHDRHIVKNMFLLMITKHKVKQRPTVLFLLELFVAYSNVKLTIDREIKAFASEVLGPNIITSNYSKRIVINGTVSWLDENMCNKLCACYIYLGKREKVVQQTRLSKFEDFNTESSTFIRNYIHVVSSKYKVR